MMRTKSRVRVIGAVAMLATSAGVQAADRYLTTGSNTRFWNSTDTWSTTIDGPGGASIPVDGDNVFLITDTGTSVTVFEYTDYPGAGINNLTIGGNATSSSISLNQDIGTTLTVAGVMSVGRSGTTSSSGIYLLNDGTLRLTGTNPAGSLRIGEAGAGQFNTNGGVVSVAGSVVVGNAYQGVVNQADGNMTIGTASVGQSLTVAKSADVTSVYSFGRIFSASTATLDLWGDAIIGDAGTGIADMAGQTVNVKTASDGNGGSIYLGKSANSTGFFTVRKGTINVEKQIVVGGDATTPGGFGSLLVLGGTVNTQLLVHPGSTVRVNGGTLNAFAGASNNIINNGSISLEAGTLNVGGPFTGSGTFSQTGGTLGIADKTAFNNGTQTFSGGTTTGAGDVAVAKANGSSSTISVTGSAAVTIPGTLTAGNNGTLTGGTGSGTIAVSSGSLYAGTVLLGSTTGGSGHMTVSGSAAVTIGGGLTTNDLTVSGGSLTVLDQNPPSGEDPVLDRAIVGGYLRDGELAVSGGIVTTPKIKLGVTTGQTGTYTQTGGMVNVTTLGIGSDASATGGTGTGVAALSGGTVNAGDVMLGSTDGGKGSLAVSNSATLNVTSTLSTNTTSSMTVNSGGIVDSEHMVVKSAANVIHAGGQVTVGAAGMDFIAGAAADPSWTIDSSSALPGKLILEGDVTASFTGAATVWIALGPGTIPNAGVVNLGGGTRNFTVNNGPNAVDMEIGASITQGTLQKSGPGTLRLTGDNSYSQTILSGGTLDAAGIHALGTGGIAFQGGRLNLRGDVPANSSMSFGGDLTSTQNGTITVDLSRASGEGALGTFEVGALGVGPALTVGGTNGGTLRTASTVTLNAAASINNTVNVTFDGLVTGEFGITKTGTGTLQLGGPVNNTYAGLTTINNGTLNLNKTSNAIAIPAGLSVNAGLGTASVTLLASEQIANAATVALVSTNAILNLNGQTETIAGLTGAGKVMLGTGGVLHVDTAAASAFNGVISGTGQVTKGGGNNTFTLGGASNFAGTMGVSSGTLVVGNADALGASTLSINNAVAQVQSGLTKAVSVSSVSTNGTGKLDLTNNALIVKNSTLGAIDGLVTQGYNNGDWFGGGITSATAANDPNGLTAVGYFTNADFGATAFEGVSGLDADDIFVKYTYYGDTDLNGFVDADDFNQFLAGFQDPMLPRTWLYGDFDYNNLIDADDFNLFLATYQFNGAPLSELVSAIELSSLNAADQQTLLGVVAAVPEPTSFSVLAVAACGFAARRRRASRAEPITVQ